jgi:hypothetical protein
VSFSLLLKAYTTNLRGTPVENVKRSKIDQPYCIPIQPGVISKEWNGQENGLHFEETNS